FEPDVDELGGIWGLSRHADIMHASKHPELFSSGKSSRPEPGSWIPSMINLDDPLHKRRRNLVNRGFTVRRVAAHEATLRALCDDLMSILVHSELDGDRLAEEEILQESLLILIGGDETTRHVMTGGLHALLEHPDQKRELTRNPALLPTAVEEMLRWVSPI